MTRKELFKLLCIERIDYLCSAFSEDNIFKSKIENYSSISNEFDLILNIADKIIEKSNFIENSKQENENIYHEFKKEEIL